MPNTRADNESDDAEPNAKPDAGPNTEPDVCTDRLQCFGLGAMVGLQPAVR